MKKTLIFSPKEVTILCSKKKMILIFGLIALFCAALQNAAYSSDTKTQSVIESQIDGEFEGWDGETVVKLTNGQIWIQMEYYYEYNYAYRPEVLVYKSPSGGWKMRVEGIKKAISVERLK
jgi:hypothetical protein